MAPFKARCEKVASAVARANRETGGRCLYLPNLAGRSEDLMDFARFAKAGGAGGVLVLPGLFGFDLMRRLAADDDVRSADHGASELPRQFRLSDTLGFTHAMMFGVCSVWPAPTSRSSPMSAAALVSAERSVSTIAHACRDPDGIGKPIFPSPGGGMSVERAGEMKRMYGDDVVFLLGGSLLRHIDRIGDTLKEMRARLA